MTLRGLRLEMSNREGATIVVLDGEIDLANASDLRSALISSVSETTLGLIIDLSEVTYLDSAAIQVLFETARVLELSGRPCGLRVPESSPLRTVLKITRMEDAVAICSSLEECSASLRHRRRELDG